MKMKELKNTPTYEWKTIQFFVSLTGISEVQISSKNSMRCSCEGYNVRKKCKHIVFCLNEVNADLVYPIKIAESTPQEYIDRAKTSAEDFRTLLLKYGRILAL